MNVKFMLIVMLADALGKSGGSYMLLPGTRCWRQLKFHTTLTR